MAGKKRKKNILIIIVLSLLIIVFGFSLWKVITISSEYRKGTDAYDEALALIDLPVGLELDPEAVVPSDAPAGTAAGGDQDPSSYLQPSQTSDTDTESAASEEETRAPEAPLPVRPDVLDFSGLQAVNPDIAGWIYIGGTRISYPITQGTDNAFYMNHMYNGQPNSAGCIFMDSLNSRGFTDKNTILYGHNMNNGSMFHGLAEYKNQAFFDSHRYGEIFTPDGNYSIEFFAGYVANVEDDAWRLYYEEGQFGTWCQEQIARSCFAGGTAPSEQDRIVTLSTCSYEFNNARFVLMGILRPAGE